jgi:glycerol uptake facilitator-like aquaporin
MGKLDLRTTLGYIVAQLIGAIVGSLPLLLWGAMGKSVAFGATLPGSGTTLSTVLLGEVDSFSQAAESCLRLPEAAHENQYVAK